jgi:hypothetical protein
MSEAQVTTPATAEINPEAIPNARVPNDTLHLLMEHYVQARLDELEADADSGQGYRKARPSGRYSPSSLSPFSMKSYDLQPLHKASPHRPLTMLVTYSAPR